MSRTNFHGPKVVQAILKFKCITSIFVNEFPESDYRWTSENVFD